MAKQRCPNCDRDLDIEVRELADIKHYCRALSRCQCQDKKEWEIWCEWPPDGSKYFGTYKGETFAEACEAWFDATGQKESLFDRIKLTYYGLKMHDSKVAAESREGWRLRPPAKDGRRVNRKT